jgi:hypothetical protein
MIQERLGIDSTLTPTDQTGQFDVIVDGKVIASRGGNVATRILLGAGFPDPSQVVAEISRLRG